MLIMKDGKLVAVVGDPDSPTSQGYICAKGEASPELLYHPDRLKYPLKRVGARGENKWQRISWDEALDTVSAQHGWWFPEKEPWEYGFKESNVNMITPSLQRDPHTGSMPWRAFLCKIYKV